MTPIVQGETLTYRRDEQEQEQELTVGTPAWFAWLETASTFSFVSDEGLFTARHERSGQQRGGRYWKAYRKQHGKLSSRYLGKSEALSLERLRAVALADAPVVATHPDDATPPVSSVPPAGDPLLATKLHLPRPRAAGLCLGSPRSARADAGQSRGGRALDRNQWFVCRGRPGVPT